MYKVVILAIFFCIKGFANDVNYFEENTSLVTSDNNEENPTDPPIEMEPTAPISDYQYALLASAIGLGVYGFFKHKKVKTI